MRNFKRSFPLGIIAEDNSDIESIKLILNKIKSQKNFKINHFVGDGCGKIRRKCKTWADQLHLKGCRGLIIIHDLDKNEVQYLTKEIFNSIDPCPIKKYLICIPIEELEAWFLSDMDAIKKVFKLKKLPKEIHHPERVVSPKEEIGRIVYAASNQERRYLNTVHNGKISECISIDKIKKKCPSFLQLHKFIVELT